MEMVNNQIHVARKCFQINRFGEFLTEIKFWNSPATWTSIKQVVPVVIQQVACEKINGCNKMSCSQLEEKKS